MYASWLGNARDERDGARADPDRRVGFQPRMSDFVDQLRDVAAASLLPEEGELTAPGLAEPVEVLRDAWGVPYI